MFVLILYLYLCVGLPSILSDNDSYAYLMSQTITPFILTPVLSLFNEHRLGAVFSCYKNCIWINHFLHKPYVSRPYYPELWRSWTIRRCFQQNKTLMILSHHSSSNELKQSPRTPMHNAYKYFSIRPYSNNSAELWWMIQKSQKKIYLQDINLTVKQMEKERSKSSEFRKSFESISQTSYVLVCKTLSPILEEICYDSLLCPSKAI